MRSSRRTKIAFITDDTVVVGIDVAKVNHMARCTDQGHHALQALPVP